MDSWRCTIHYNEAIGESPTPHTLTVYRDWQLTAEEAKALLTQFLGYDPLDIWVAHMRIGSRVVNGEVKTLCVPRA